MKEHREAIIVGLAYIIGFTTAFIAFGLDGTGKHKSKAKYHRELPVEQTVAERGEKQIGIAIREEGLYALLSDKDRIISAQGASLINAKPGWHHQVIKTEVSPNNSYIYYCVQLVSSSSDCANFVYEVEADVVHKVSRADGEQVLSPIQGLVAGWTSDGLLTINDFVSAARQMPWKVVGR